MERAVSCHSPPAAALAAAGGVLLRRMDHRTRASCALGLFLAAVPLASCQRSEPTEPKATPADTVVMEPASAPIRAEVSFDAAGEATLQVRAGDKPVQLQLAPAGEDARIIEASRQADSWVARIRDLPPSGTALVIVETGEGEARRPVSLFEWAWTSAQPDETEIFSADGQLSILLDPGQLTEGERFSVLAAPGGAKVGARLQAIAGPYQLNGPRNLRARGVFHLPGVELKQLEDLEVLRFAPDGALSRPPITALQGTERVSFEAELPATFVLVGRLTGGTP